MKKSILFLTVLFFYITGINAQTETNTTFATQMNTMFSTLDKTKVPHGILLDFGMDFTNVEAINGTLTDSTWVNATRLKEVYNTLLSSRTRDVSTGFVTPQQFFQNWQNERSSNFIALSGLYFKYSKFVDDAVSAGKVNYSNEKFSDKYVRGIWQNPYQEMQTFAMAPAIKVHKGLSMKVKIPSSVFYSNHQNLVQNIQIDFGQGYVNVPFNQLVTVNYTSAGTKTWKYKLNLTNGTSLYSQSYIKIEEGLATVPFGGGIKARGENEPFNEGCSLYHHNITSSYSYLGSASSVRLTIDDAGCDGIRKPLIVAEGFDLGVILDPENINGINDYEGFKTALDNSQSDDLKNLIFEENKQYDIIYVNWNNGVDYLQRNAYALQSVIEWVNSVKIGNEQNVVLGQSMGGVIARYTLAHMEQNNVSHDTRLFISHDAPQQGANVPVSLQFMYRHLTNQYIQTHLTLFGGHITIPILENNFNVSTYLSILDAPASRQLLSNWSALNYSIVNTEHQNFYNELKQKGVSGSGGYPVQSRNIAISNGAECGNTQGFIPGDFLMSYNWNKSLSFLQDLASLVVIPLGGTIGGLFVDNDFFGVGLLGLVPGNSRFNVDFWTKSIPYGTGNQIYKGVISYRKKILWLIPVTVNITNVQKNQPSGILPMDTYGGGFYDTSVLAEGTEEVENLFIRDKFNFIPTASALDIGKRNVSLNDSDYKNSYVGANPPLAPKDSPFNSFSTDFDTFNPNRHNKQHISFDRRNGNWLARELNINPTVSDCSFVCSDIIISGEEIICNSNSFSVPSGGTFYNWSVIEGAGMVTLSSNGTPNVTLTNSNTGNGYITIQVNYGNTNCGNRTITKRVWVGVPKVFYSAGCFQPQMVESCFEMCQTNFFTMENYVTVEVEGLGLLTNSLDWEWEKVSGNFGWTTNGDTAHLQPYQVGNISFRVRAKNQCGWGNWLYYQISVVNCGSGPGGFSMMSSEQNFYSVYPNPSNDIAYIDLSDIENQPVTDSAITGKLYDLMGNLKSTVQVINNQATFSVQGLNTGVYVLKIYIDGQEIEAHNIAVQ